MEIRDAGACPFCERHIDKAPGDSVWLHQQPTCAPFNELRASTYALCVARFARLPVFRQAVSSVIVQNTDAAARHWWGLGTEERRILRTRLSVVPPEPIEGEELDHYLMRARRQREAGAR